MILTGIQINDDSVEPVVVRGVLELGELMGDTVQGEAVVFSQDGQI